MPWLADGRKERTYTERLRSSLMALISILRRPMVTVSVQTSRRIRRRRDTKTGHGDGMWLVSRVLEEQKKLVLACAAAGTATHEHVEGFSTQERKKASSRAERVGALCVERMLPRLGHDLYVCDARNGGPRQHSQYA
jgi:hypothetical protein